MYLFVEFVMNLAIRLVSVNVLVHCDTWIRRTKCELCNAPFGQSSEEDMFLIALHVMLLIFVVTMVVVFVGAQSQKIKEVFFVLKSLTQSLSESVS